MLAASLQPPEATAGEVQQPGTVGLSPGCATESPLEKIYIHGQAQPKLLSKICSEKMYTSVFFKELQVFSPIKLAKIPEFEYSLEKQAFL